MACSFVGRGDAFLDTYYQLSDLTERYLLVLITEAWRASSFPRSQGYPCSRRTTQSSVERSYGKLRREQMKQMVMMVSEPRSKPRVFGMAHGSAS